MKTHAEQLALRVLTKLPGFTLRARRPAEVQLRNGEHVLGAYRARTGAPPTVFTDHGIHAVSGRGWRFVPYDELGRIPMPPKTPVPTTLTVGTRHGDNIVIPVRTDERTSDAYELLRFFDRVKAPARATSVSWTHPSVMPLAADGGDPVQKIAANARSVAYDAIEAGWAGPPFDPFALAQLRGIEVRPASDVADARLVSAGQSLRIEYNPNRPTARIRYSIAHEVAHSLFPDAAEASRNRGRDADEWQLELLCNVAAAELLMPIGQLRRELADAPLGINAVITLRDTYLVSLEAVAIRLSRVSAYRVAAFAASRVEDAQGGRYILDYVLPSPGWSLPRLAGAVLPSESAVGQVHAVGFTNTSLTPERWGSDVPSLHVEAVGAPPFPGSLAPRVVGLVWPWEERPVHRTSRIQYVFGSATSPVGAGPRIIAQVVNDTASAWGGRSFASQVRAQWPSVQEQFRAWAREHGLHLGSVHVAQVDDHLSVASIVAQHRYKQLVRPGIRYEALERGLEELAFVALERRASVHMPRIGAGNARGNWDVISALIEEALVVRGISVTVYTLPDADATRGDDARRTVDR